jgi:hypothetical protein
VSVGGCRSLSVTWLRVSSGLFSLMVSCSFHVFNVVLDLFLS